MGIRIKKAIGYGAELKISDYFVEDHFEYDLPKLNKMESEELEKITTSVNYKQFIAELTGRSNFPTYIYNSLDVQPDIQYVGCEDYIGVIFTMYPNQYRSDDTIDYYESDLEALEIRELHTAEIYPMAGSYICERDCVAGKKGDLLDGGTFNQMVGRWDKNLEPLVKGEKLESYLSDWRVTPPPALCLSVFISPWITDKMGILKLVRPSLATWWS